MYQYQHSIILSQTIIIAYNRKFKQQYQKPTSNKTSKPTIPETSKQRNQQIIVQKKHQSILEKPKIQNIKPTNREISSV
jgi:hypothetical protein